MFLIRKFKKIPACEVWFRMPAEAAGKKQFISFYHNLYEPIELGGKKYILSKRDAKTLVSDLTLTADELMMRCESNVRNKIRHAAREGAVCCVYTSEELLKRENLIREFDAVYGEMHRQKQMKVSPVAGYMSDLARGNALYVSVCEIGQEAVAYHAYVAGDGIARLLYSVSVFRDVEDSGQRNAIGRANRLLHYQDMLWFKEQGYTSYDWGGYSEASTLSNISAFKKGFGGEERHSYYAIATEKKWLHCAYRLWSRRKQR